MPGYDPGGKPMRCLMCGKTMSRASFTELFRKEDVLCEACRGRWKRIDRKFRFHGVPAWVLYEYAGGFSECLLQFKECYDEALKPVFLFPDRRRIHQVFHARTLLLMPSSEKKTAERGFSHLKELFECLDLPMMEPFVKVKDDDQKNRSREERNQMRHGIALKEHIVLPEKVVLADDVITTGSTMEGALSVLPPGLNIRIFACGMAARKHDKK